MSSDGRCGMALDVSATSFDGRHGIVSDVSSLSTLQLLAAIPLGIEPDGIPLVSHSNVLSPVDVRLSRIGADFKDAA